ncbi:MAG: DNRLRE domain-containing protein [Bacteroidia bacterium]
MKHSFPKLTLNWSKYFFFFLYFIISAFSGLEHLSAQTSTTIVADLDNTLIEDVGGLLSNGSGNYFFAGRTGQTAGSIRRGLVHFPMDNIPANAIIDSVSLMLNMSQGSGTGTQTVKLHRVMASWGEGSSAAAGNEGAGAASTTGDATWIHRFYDTDSWTTAGGDFLAVSSGSLDVPSTAGNNNWSGAGLVADVAYWITQPDSNFGWVLVGDESKGNTARRFGSHNNSDEGLQPRLFVRYTLPDANDDLLASFGLEIFPNPANERIALKWEGKQTGFAQVNIFDINGKIALHHPESVLLQQGNLSLSISGLNPGIYLVKFSTGEFDVFRKLIIQ